MKNLIIINGYNDFTGKGGAIYIVCSAQYTIINCTFNNNWAKGFGGAIYSEAKKPLTIINCSFNNNKANYITGGAIYWFNVNDFTVTNCNFTGNTANNGGAISGEKATSTVTNCSFTGNTANNDGGAIHWFGVNAAVTNCNSKVTPQIIIVVQFTGMVLMVLLLTVISQITKQIIIMVVQFTGLVLMVLLLTVIS